MALTPREAAALQCRRWAQQGRRVVFTNGVFDLLHRGHVLYLEQARALGDVLVVGINDDASARRLGKGPGRPLNPLRDRGEVLAALRAVDLVVPFQEETPRELISLLRPQVLVKGGDYTEDQVAGGAEVREWGGQVVIVPFTAGYSTTGLIRRIKHLEGIDD
jgi:D-glycero-beta-D-manno-heptose 1-phosphate adenylyltransferase